VTGITVQEMSDVAAQLRDAIAEHDTVCAQLADAEKAHKRAYLKAHANSTAMHDYRKVKEHEVAAEEASFDEWAELNALQYRLKALKESMHSLRQILSSFQTQARIEADFDRTVPRSAA
jgi:vancomycin resistance protein YoaR